MSSCKSPTATATARCISCANRSSSITGRDDACNLTADPFHYRSRLTTTDHVRRVLGAQVQRAQQSGASVTSQSPSSGPKTSSTPVSPPPLLLPRSSRTRAPLFASLSPPRGQDWSAPSPPRPPPLTQVGKQRSKRMCVFSSLSS
jgi:hypothetical protein